MNFDRIAIFVIHVQFIGYCAENPRSDPESEVLCCTPTLQDDTPLCKEKANITQI